MGLDPQRRISASAKIPPISWCHIHKKEYSRYEDGTTACIDCIAQYAVRNIGVARGSYPRIRATISSIEADVLDTLFTDMADKKGVDVLFVFSMLVSSYAKRFSLTFDQVIEKICDQKSASMILPLSF